MFCTMYLPSESAHTGHKCGIPAGMAQRVHPMISHTITQLVCEGATRIEKSTLRVCKIRIKREMSGSIISNQKHPRCKERAAKN